MENPDKLTIPLEKICAIIQLSRQYDAKDVLTDPGSGSNGSDDGMRSILEDHADDAVGTELRSVIQDLNEDEQIDLVALAWLGRGDGMFDSWDDLRKEAGNAHNDRTAQYLLGIPLLSDYLEEAIESFGLSRSDVGED